MRLKDKVAVITGSGRGIGKATAILFAREGAKVGVACRSENEGKETVDEIAREGGSAIFVRTDISIEKDAINLIETTVKRFGKLNILVNNAAIFCTGTVLDATPELYDRIFSVNVKGMGLCSKAAIPHLRKSGNGAIVNVSSMNGVIGTPSQAVYNASKAAIIELTKSMAIDFPELRVNAVLPGITKTKSLDDSIRGLGYDIEEAYKIFGKLPLRGRFAEPMEVAYAILFMASDEASYATGSTLLYDGGVASVNSLRGGS